MAEPASASLEADRLGGVLQILIGNTDAHGKHISFFLPDSTIELASAYDLVCTRLYPKHSEDLSMAIGDARTFNEISPYEWGVLATKLVQRDTAHALRTLANRGSVFRQNVDGAVARAIDDAQREGADISVVHSVAQMIHQQAGTLGEHMYQLPGVQDLL